MVEAGFGRVGGEHDDAVVEAEIGHVAGRSGVRLLGPNGFGPIVADIGLAHIAWRDVPPEVGRSRYAVGQRAIALCRLWALELRRPGQNQLDVGGVEFLHHLATWAECDAVALYLEGIQRGDRRCSAQSRRATRQRSPSSS